MRVMVEDGKAPRPSLLGATVKTVVIVGGMSWFAASWMSSATDKQAMAQLASRVSRGEEPLTTGSIGSRAAATKLDPCSLPKR
jgi:hypothetical protein